MALFSNQYQDSEGLTFQYTHSTFDKGEALYFSRVKSDLDGQRINAFIEEHGGDATDIAERIRATVWCQLRRSTLKLPKGFKQPVLDSDSNPVEVDGVIQTEPHPFAGKVAPMSFELVCSLPESVLIDALGKMGEHYNPDFDSRRSSKSVQDPLEGVSAPAEP